MTDLGMNPEPDLTVGCMTLAMTHTPHTRPACPIHGPYLCWQMRPEPGPTAAILGGGCPGFCSASHPAPFKTGKPMLVSALSEGATRRAGGG
mmetsp:Transcript_14396/g.25598  ORF Transcript_14396/g.25598 Transcript_14396/m.25598 type:complete len:92 (+) Transcript_14396:446-721(+)